jgi:hypothetical protein
MKTSDFVLLVVIVACCIIGGARVVHSLPWVGMLLGLSVGIPISLFVTFIRIGCRSNGHTDRAPLQVEDITGEPHEDNEGCRAKECNKIRSLSQGL